MNKTDSTLEVKPHQSDLARREIVESAWLPRFTNHVPLGTAELRARLGAACSKGTTAISTIKVPRGRPAFADTQRDRILALLRKAGSQGVRREDLLYVHRWSQAGTRIHELERMGYVIEHALEPGQRFVTYRLLSEPIQPKPLTTFDKKPCAGSGDWFERAADRERPRETDDLPLFSSRSKR